MRLVDSHCHVQADRFAEDADAVLEAARVAGVERILVPGWNLASTRDAVALVERQPWLDASAGVHPHDAAAIDERGWAAIVALAEDPRVVAVGETGLDFDRAFSPVDAQLVNLRRNLALALDTGKAAILHCRSKDGQRDAQDTLLDELRRAGFGGAAGARAFGERPAAVIHSFSGPLDYARAALDLNLTISFSGLVFRRGEETSAAVAAIVPPDRLLVETDSPYLAPPGAPRRRNAPEWVRITADWIAEQRGVPGHVLGDDLVRTYDATFRARRAAG